HEAERVLDHPAVAGFTGIEGHLYLALVGHILAADDEILNLPIRPLQGAQRPADAATEAHRHAPGGFMGSGDLAGSGLTQPGRGPGTVIRFEHLVDKPATCG